MKYFWETVKKGKNHDGNTKKKLKVRFIVWREIYG